ncbi:UNVERIFIED_CONTAM: hypothetical protein PYX00_007159 [Menopon gallinae]|uniref:TLC domain-containing protein n=1 Tax=Menopon gallinae TaxID=328185 RepID=A0AAW2HHY9_9NEOP
MNFISENLIPLLLPPSPCNECCSACPWTRILVFFLIWWLIYYALKFVARKEPEYRCRCITLIHGVLTTCFTMTDIISTKQNFDLNLKIPLTDFQFYFLSITLSYFIYDLIWINLIGAEPIAIHLHHICSILLLSKVMTSDTGGPGVSYGLFGLEFTNPYLQLRWFLRTHGYHNRPIHIVVELWFMFTFVFIRSVGGTLLLYFVEVHPEVDIFLKIAFIGIYIVSWLLVVQVIQFYKKKYMNLYPLLSGSVLSIFPYRRRIRNHTSNAS